MTSQGDTSPEFVTPGSLSYLVTTGEWTFFPGDPSGLADPKDKAWFSTIVDGPYSSMALAERAADLRLNRIRSDMWTATEQFEPHGMGGGIGDAHGGYGSWKRDLIWHDTTRGGRFGDRNGWQQINAVVTDTLP